MLKFLSRIFHSKITWFTVCSLLLLWIVNIVASLIIYPWSVSDFWILLGFGVLVSSFLGWLLYSIFFDWERFIQ